MAVAILITGFNNWGKSTIIQQLFDRGRFDYGKPIPLSNTNASFVVEPCSNDDFSYNKYIYSLKKRMIQKRNADLLCAFCPTLEKNNNSRDILNDKFFKQFEVIFLVLLVNKWDHHAKLNVKNIQAAYTKRNIRYIIIDADNKITGADARLKARLHQIKTEIMQLNP